MNNIGASTVPFKGGVWGGMSTQSRSSQGFFELLENCYVSSDGQEIRPMPGFKTYMDFTTARGLTTASPAAGFYRDVVDAKVPTIGTTGNYTYRDTSILGVEANTLSVYADPTHVHGFEQVSGRWILFGETRHRVEPIKDSGGINYVYVTAYSYDGGTGETILTLSSNYLTGAGAFHAVDTTALPNSRSNFRIWLTGLTGGGASALNVSTPFGTPHTVTAFPAANQIRINTSITSAANNATGQTGVIGWVTRDYDSSSTVSDDHESLTIWTAAPDDVNEPLSICWPAYVANRQRDFGDWVAVPNIILEGGSAGCSRRRQAILPYRIVPHVAGNRLIMVAPGYNCVFQAPVVIPVEDITSSQTHGITWRFNDVYDKPRSLGLPKAIMFVDNETSYSANNWNIRSGGGADTAFGGSDHTDRAGTYKFAVAYKDEVTGETGVISEPMTLTIDPTSVTKLRVRIIVLFPGYLLCESLAMSINLYRTAKNGEAFYFDQSFDMATLLETTPTAFNFTGAVYGAFSSGTPDEYWHCIHLHPKYTADDLLRKNRGAVPKIEQMPMGCKAARTVRGGWTVFGGALGNSGVRNELWESSLSMTYNSSAGAAATFATADLVHHKLATNLSATFGLTTDTTWGCAGKGLPSSYSGQEIVSQKLFPYPRQVVRLSKVVNNVSAGTTGTASLEMRQQRWQVEKSPLLNAVDIDRQNQPTFLRLPRGRLQISEADNPGVVPVTNTTIVSKEESEDIEGIGEANGQMVVCTRSKTYIVAFGQSPVGIPGEQASDQFGCIGANTMVSFDHGCAWISDRGPCAVVNGGFQWIGQQIQHLFHGPTARYLRDSTGMMRHAWGAHDAERGLIYFGMFADRGNGTSDRYQGAYAGSAQYWSGNPADANDQAKSRFPCDEILVYSYRVGAWSVWRPSLKLLVKWMTSGIDSDGIKRMFFLGSDNRVYVLDDKFSEWNKDAVELTVAAANTTAATTVSVTGASVLDATITGRGAADNYWNAGMHVLVVSQQEGRPLIKATTLSNVEANQPSAGLTRLTLADAVTVAAGDKVYVGVRKMTVKTNYANLKLGEATRVGRIGVRYSMESLYGNGGDTQHLAYASARAVTSVMRNSVPTRVEVSLTAGDSSDGYTLLGIDSGDGLVIERQFSQGSVQGQNTKVDMTIYSGASVRLNDFYMDIQ